MIEKKIAISLKKAGVYYKRRTGFFSHEKFWALKNISFDLYHGETIGVLGRNGVGKSTLLRLLAGIIAPDRGSVINHGVSVSLLALQAGFLPHLTGRENVILGGMLLGLSKSEILARMEDVRSFADIGDFFEQPVHSYSLGMRARLGFSVAAYADPDVVLLDEVMGVGDELFREKSSKTILELAHSDKSVILVSHQPAMHRKLCNRLVWVEGGEVLGVGDVDSILLEYSRFNEKNRLEQPVGM